MIQVIIKASKTDPFHQETSLYLAAIGRDLCPVMAILNYLVVRGTSSGPLFHLQNGHYLTREGFVNSFWEALSSAGYQSICWTQFSAWGCNNCSKVWYLRLTNPDSRQVAKFCLYKKFFVIDLSSVIYYIYSYYPSDLPVTDELPDITNSLCAINITVVDVCI